MTTTLEEYVSRVVAEAPPLSQEQIDRIAVLLRPSDYETTTGPSPASIRASKIAEAEAELDGLHNKMVEAMSGCRGCGLSRKVHHFQASQVGGYHNHEPMTPDQAIDVARAYKKKIRTAEKVLEDVSV